MKITIIRDSRTPVYIQIKNQIKALILNGELATGVKLLPERKMAQIIGVSRGTISHVYAELCADGFVNSKQGDGFRVANDMTEDAGKTEMKRRKLLSNPWKYFETNENVIFNLGYEELSSLVNKNGIIMSDCVIDPNIIPVSEIQETINRLFVKKSNELFGYASPQGLQNLRSSTSKILAAKHI